MPTTDDRNAVTHVIASLIDAWRRHDADAYGAQFTQDATYVTFAGTYLDIALRDCGIRSFLIAGIALEVGIEPTVRHATDLGYLPTVVTDACGWGNAEAAKRSLEALAFAGGSLQTDIASLRTVLSEQLI
jgi:nicotinamidase-related amidase